MVRKPVRKIYERNDPALLVLIAKRPRYVNVWCTVNGERGWVRVFRPKISNLTGEPLLTGDVEITPKWQGVAYSE